MANQATVEKVRGMAAEVQAFQRDSLVERGDWGTFNFRDVAGDLQLVQDLASHLRELPIELVPDNVANDLNARLTNVRDALKRIDGFDLTNSQNPRAERQSFADQLKSLGSELLVAAQGWIAFLAYQKGDVQKNIRDLGDAVQNAKGIVERAEIYAKQKAADIDGIVAAAREASAAVGVGHFTTDFAGEAGRMDTEAGRWLKATAGFAGATLVVAVLFLTHALPPEATAAQIAHFITSKLIILAVLLTATVWCGRLFKASKHQAAMNHHRANALKTFQAFVKATGDEPTRDAVLLETTRSIFAIAPSGYLDATETSPDGGAKMLEIVRAAKPA